MIAEDILFALVVIGAIYLVGRMLFRGFLSWRKAKSDPIAEAKERIRLAELEIEAARLNAQADKMIGGLYDEQLREERVEPKRVASDEEVVEALDEQMEKIEKGKRHHG